MTLDFSKFDGNTRKFENFVCDLAFCLQPSNAKPNGFVNLNGNGGDCGTECYWELSDNTIWAYQAKLFNKLESSQIKQVKDSLEKAISSYPNLRQYDIFLSIDGITKFNDVPKSKSKRATRKGSDGSFSSLKETLRLIAEPNNILVNVYTQKDIESIIPIKNLHGLSFFYFEKEIFSKKWFEDRGEAALANLGERFMPSKHVRLPEEHRLNLLLQTSYFKKILIDKLEQLREIDYNPRNSSFNGDAYVKICVDEMDAQFHELTVTLGRLKREKSLYLKIDQLNVCLNTITHNIGLLYGKAKALGLSDYAISQMFERTECDVEEIKKILCSDENLDYGKKLIIIKGEPGMGKSHLLGKILRDKIINGAPAIFVLGSSIDSNLQKAILDSVSCGHMSFEDFFGTLSVSANYYGENATIIVDAVNESAVKKICDELPGIFQKIKQHGNISLIISCRSDYLNLYIRNDLQSEGQIIEAKGFNSYNSWEESMKLYFDEDFKPRPIYSFSHPIVRIPLFVKLLAENSSNIGGTAGVIDILNTYVDNIANNVATKFNTMPSYIRYSIYGIADYMAKNRVESISVTDARNIITSAFGGIANPCNQSIHWADIFCDERVFRKDKKVAKLKSFGEPEFISFYYQTITSYLIVDSILKNISDYNDIFKDGNFDFLLDNGKIKYQHVDLIKALSVFIPERYDGIEIYDCLPSNIDIRYLYLVNDSFEESIVIRSTDQKCFSHNTLDCINKHLGGVNSRTLEMFIKVSLSKKHPYNAYFLNAFFKSKNISQRDKLWSSNLKYLVVPVKPSATHTPYLTDHESEHYGEELGVIEEIIEWIDNCKVSKINKDSVELASIILCWALTSPNRILRDRSTRALVKIYLNHPDCAIHNIENFKDIDDLYVMERIICAVYGASLIGMNPESISIWSSTIYKVIFEHGAPPSHLLLRDYARQTIELGVKINVLDEGIDLAKVRPPYKNKVRLSRKERGIDYYKNKFGDVGIYLSCNSLGDFACYKIERHCKFVTNILLSKPRPLTSEEMLEFFKSSILIKWSNKKKKEFEKLESLSKAYNHNIISTVSYDIKKCKMRINLNSNKKLSVLKNGFEKMLSNKELRSFKKYAEPELFNVGGVCRRDSVNIAAAKQWITDKAYSFGFNSKNFPHDENSRVDYSRDRPIRERIGKKYQWLAFYDFLSKLTDKYWIYNFNNVGENQVVQYTEPEVLGSLEDIDPSILLNCLNCESERPVPFLKLKRNLKALSGSENTKWLEDEKLDFYQKKEDIQIEFGKDKFLVLFSYFNIKSRGRINCNGNREVWNRTNSYVLKKRDLQKFLTHIKKLRLEDSGDFLPSGVYTGKLYEYARGFKDISDDSHLGFKENGLDITHTVFNFSDDGRIVDLEKEHKVNVYLPNLKIREALSITINPNDVGEFRDISNNVIFKNFKSRINSATFVIIKEKEFFEYLENNDLVCVWTLGGEKLVLPAASEGKINSGLVYNSIFIGKNKGVKLDSTKSRDFYKKEKGFV